MVELLTGVQQQLTRYVRTLVPNRSDAEEVLQETNLFIWRHCEQYEWGTNFAAWARSIAYYQVLTYRKRHARSRLCFSDALVEQLAASAAEASAGRPDDVETFEGCVAKLSDQDRLLVDLRYEPGATVQSVAEKVGRSTKAVYHALGRIRTWLLECMRRSLSERRRA
jgi:RNA polymerase sigma-70 factor (ECF subfamily)